MSTQRNIIFLSILIYYLRVVAGQNGNKRLVCYYDTESSMRFGNAKFSTDYLHKAASHCTHLVYASAHLDPKTYELKVPVRFVNPKNVKRRHSHVKLFLRLGGDEDANDRHDPLKYQHLLESDRAKQLDFINKTVDTLQMLGFHGLDLAFPLPRDKPREDKCVAIFLNDLANMWSNSKTDIYKHYYTKFVNELQVAFNRANLSLAMTVLPNVNSTLYFDIAKIKNNFEFINLFAFDFHTPQRNPREADYSAPLFFNKEQKRLPQSNVDFQVNYWLNKGCPANKLNLGIATFGRAWKLTIQSGLSGQPIVEDTRGAAGFGRGNYSTGLISWTEICLHLPPQRRHGTSLRQITDEYGNYAFRTADAKNHHGLWISYDDPEFAATKTKYAKDKSLGGVALFDLSRDDFRGLCRGGNAEYPILQSIRKTLNISIFPETKIDGDILRNPSYISK